MGDSVRLLTSGDAARWTRALAGVPGGGEPSFQHAFYEAAQRQMGAEAECFVFESDGARVVYPYLRRRLDRLPFLAGSPWCDVVGGYGYNGAVSTTRDVAVLRRFREAFAEHARTTKVLTEFVRFHPLLDNAPLFSSDCEIMVQNKNVALDLARPLEEIRARYEHSCRKNIKKAVREGVTVAVEEGAGPRFGEFLRVYDETMARVGAEKAYAFDPAYFETLAAGLEPRPLFFYAELKGRVVSTEMALRSGEIIYSYLGGTDAAAFDARPNNLLKDALIGWAHAAGLRRFLLGGGKSPDDGIFRYKLTFAPEGTVEFRVGLRVHDRAAYEDVLERWGAAFPDQDPADRRLQRYWD